MTKRTVILQRKRSQQKETKRDKKNRKSIGQKMALWQFYKQLNGETPSKQTIENLAAELQLKVPQVYKWFWDMNRKVDNCVDVNTATAAAQAAQLGNKPPSKSTVAVKGLSNELCAQAFPNLPDLGNIQPDEFELLAIEVGIDVEKLAQEIIDSKDTNDGRQIVKRVRRVVKKNDEDFEMQESPKALKKETSTAKKETPPVKIEMPTLRTRKSKQASVESEAKPVTKTPEIKAKVELQLPEP